MSLTQSIGWSVSTETVPDAFDRYLVGMTDFYGISEISDWDRRHFHNASRGVLTPFGTVGEGRSVRQRLSRDASVLRRSDMEGLHILMNRAAMQTDNGERQVDVPAGAVQFRDMSRPSISRLEAVDVVTIVVPRLLTPARLLESDVHGLSVDPGSAYGRLLGAHMQTLMETSIDLSEPELEAAFQALLLVASRVTGSERLIGESERAALQRTVRNAASDQVEKQLRAGNPVIDLGKLAAAAGVSRATLYRAFEASGGVQRFIQDRRLRHAQIALRHRRGNTPTIADIAYQFGFASPTHFSRLFRARFGIAPSDVEPLTLKGEASLASGPIRHDVIVDWMKSLGARS